MKIQNKLVSFKEELVAGYSRLFDKNRYFMFKKKKNQCNVL